MSACVITNIIISRAKICQNPLKILSDDIFDDLQEL